MTGVWFVSYLLLWLVVVVLSLLVFGMLQHLGSLQHQLLHLPSPLSEPFPDTVLPLAQDGPPIEALLPVLDLDTVNNFGAVSLSLHEKRNVLLLFLSPLCESCQHIVGPLNHLMESGRFKGDILVILKADPQACQAFLNIFPLSMPVICDVDRTITMHFSVHRNPFGLLYNAHGFLIGKGVVENTSNLEILLLDMLEPQAV